MVEYTFLLGSGTSLKSGVQGVGEVTESVFGYDYWETTDDSYLKGKHPSETLREHYDVKPIQDFLGLLKERADNYYKDRFEYNNKANYEDLFDIVKQINEEVRVIRDNPVLEDFIRDIERATFTIRKNYREYPNGEAIDLGYITQKALGFIETVVKYGLNEREIEGLDVIEKLIVDGHSLNLFTLNHDLLLEKLCESSGVEYTDGFSPLDGEVRWYKPGEWDNERRIKIYKLHGSRNWEYVNHLKRGQTYAIVTGKEKWFAKDKEGIKVEVLLNKGHILTGQKKSEKYYTGIHGEIHYRFSHHLRTCSKLIVSGYGWNDLQMNNKIFDWLYGEPENKLILIHKDPEDMALRSRFLSYDAVPKGEKNGKITVIKKWFEEVELNDILKFNNA